MRIKKQQGFSLIELSIVLIVIGILIGPLITFMRLYYAEKYRRITNENLEEISVALGGYYREFSHYPCPARLDLGASDIGYGEETECQASDPFLGNEQGKKAAQSNWDTGLGCPNGICNTTGDGNQSIKIGALPFRALGLPAVRTLDGYKNKITYAVTESYAVDTPREHLGAISIENNDGDSLIEPEGSAQFILISHGRDGKGAYNASGRLNGSACEESKGIDHENCDHDGLFIDGEYAQAQGEGFFDDFVFYKMIGTGVLWEASPYDQTSIYNTTKGKVGIGTNNPQQKLDVNGNIRALGDVNAQRFCNPENAACFEPGLIGGDGMHCPEGLSMKGIKDAAPICEAAVTEGLDEAECVDGQYMIGFHISGAIICAIPSWEADSDGTVKVDLDEE